MDNLSKFQVAVFSVVSGAAIGMLAASQLTQMQLAVINDQVGKSVKEQQISNRNDACFEYINKSIVEDLKVRKQ